MPLYTIVHIIHEIP